MLTAVVVNNENFETTSRCINSHRSVVTDICDEHKFHRVLSTSKIDYGIYKVLFSLRGCAGVRTRATDSLYTSTRGAHSPSLGNGKTKQKKILWARQKSCLKYRGEFLTFNLCLVSVYMEVPFRFGTATDVNERHRGTASRLRYKGNFVQRLVRRRLRDRTTRFTRVAENCELPTLFRVGQTSSSSSSSR